MNVAARMIRVVVTHSNAEPMMTTASDLPLGTTVQEVGQRTAVVNFLVEVKHKLAAFERGILEIVSKLDCIEIAGIRTELAEHAVAQVVLIVIKHLFLLARLRVFGHVGRDLDGTVRACLFAQGASRTLVGTVLITLEYQAATMAGRYMECGLAVLGVLLRRLVGEEVLEVFLPSNLHSRCQRLQAMPDFSEI